MSEIIDIVVSVPSQVGGHMLKVIKPDYTPNDTPNQGQIGCRNLLLLLIDGLLIFGAICQGLNALIAVMTHFGH